MKYTGCADSVDIAEHIKKFKYSSKRKEEVLNKLHLNLNSSEEIIQKCEKLNKQAWRKNMKDIYIKSPYNWIGNKNKIMPQLQKIFPPNIDTLVDFFCGGCDVAINTPALHVIAIDVNQYLIDMLKAFQSNTLAQILNFIDSRIKEFNLSKENEEGFLRYREAYNTDENYQTPLDLFTLTRFSFHFTMRFNKQMKFNAGFGRKYSNFSARQRETIKPFHQRIQNVELLNMNFLDVNLMNFEAKTHFLYFDPPYLITNNVYNNGVEEAWQRWDEQDEQNLLNYISNAHKLGFKFALSNVIQHRGKTNNLLANWIEKNNFNIFEITNDGYSHCTHTVSQDAAPTREIVVTNY